jgi:hypothetical protein
MRVGILIAVILLAAVAFGQKPVIAVPSYHVDAQSMLSQTFGEGSVVFALPLPGPGDFRAFDFNLCCGAPGLWGYLDSGFDYEGEAGGAFNLTLKTEGPCAAGCTFTGSFTTWNPSQRIDQYCIQASGALVGTLTNGVEVYDGVSAEYSQPLCVDGDVGWSPAGGLTVHWEQ